MTKAIVGLFDEPADARATVEELAGLGIGRDSISVVAAQPDLEDETELATHSYMGEHAGIGVGIGGILGGIGGLVAGLTVLAIPGFGVFLAAGPIAVMLAGIGVGAAAGGVVGALTGLGVPEEHAHAYAESIRRGGTLVTVEAELSQTGSVGDAMKRHHAVDVHARVTRWREGGWTHYDERAPVFTPDQTQRERVLNAEMAERFLRGEHVPRANEHHTGVAKERALVDAAIAKPEGVGPSRRA